MTNISKKIIKWLGWNIELDNPLSSRRYIIVVTNQIVPWELLLTRLMLWSIGIGGLVMYYLRFLGKPRHRGSTDGISFTDVVNDYRYMVLNQQYKSMYVNLVGKYNLVGTWHTCIHSIKNMLELEVLSGFLDRKNKTLRLRHEICNSRIERLGREDLGQLNHPSDTPTSWKELRDLITLAMLEFGEEVNLNWIDTSQIIDMSGLFASLREFNGNISEWNVSNVEDMRGMFQGSKFNGDIGRWDVGEVVNMSQMFADSEFNRDIGDWKIDSLETFDDIFSDSAFNRDISKWTYYRPDLPLKECLGSKYFFKIWIEYESATT